MVGGFQATSTSAETPRKGPQRPASFETCRNDQEVVHASLGNVGGSATSLHARMCGISVGLRVLGRGQSNTSSKGISKF